MNFYNSWEEAKQAIRDKTDELLEIGKEPGVERLRFEFDIPAASPWHRVEDELPDLLQFVVVCNDEGKCVVAQYVGYQADSLTPWRIAYTMYDTDIYDEQECGPVRYWMPIEPPEWIKDVDDPPEFDPCYECGGYGDDYHIDEDGELVSNCPDCPFNKKEGET